MQLERGEAKAGKRFYSALAQELASPSAADAYADLLRKQNRPFRVVSEVALAAIDAQAVSSTARCTPLPAAPSFTLRPPPKQPVGIMAGL